MTRYHHKQELIEAIIVEHRRLDANLALLTPKEMLLPGVVGTWNTKVLIAHLTAWEQLFIYWYDCGQRKITPDPCPTGMSRSEIDTLNALLYERNRERPLEKVMDEYPTLYAQVLELVQALPEEGLFNPGAYPWTGRFSLADYVAANTCQHYCWAKTLLRKWLNQQGQITT
jgi:hypothetical protein